MVYEKISRLLSCIPLGYSLTSCPGQNIKKNISCIAILDNSQQLITVIAAINFKVKTKF